MTSEKPPRPPRRPRAVPARSASSAADGDLVFNELLSLLGDQLGETAQAAAPQTGKRKLKGVHFEYADDPRGVHQFAGGAGYSLASNWFTQLLGQLAIANSITKSQLCVFLFVAGGQTPGTGIAEYTQQEITDGLNELAAKKEGAKKITRPTVNRAVRALCEYKWFEPAGNGRIRLNVTLWFQGNSTTQHEVLAQIAADHGDAPDAFPRRIGPAVVHHQEELDLNLGDEAPAARKKRTG
ncbi:hypothetical protein [Streptomyces syringium]|uniref:hypothetical protein n=1 Tax=Streptomyces syringium TaxID=76729 RepID=UPI003AAB3BF7